MKLVLLLVVALFCFTLYFDLNPPQSQRAAEKAAAAAAQDTPRKTPTPPVLTQNYKCKTPEGKTVFQGTPCQGASRTVTEFGNGTKIPASGSPAAQ